MGKPLSFKLNLATLFFRLFKGIDLILMMRMLISILILIKINCLLCAIIYSTLEQAIKGLVGVNYLGRVKKMQSSICDIGLRG